jgi:hypothetical protein
MLARLFLAAIGADSVLRNFKAIAEPCFGYYFGTAWAIFRILGVNGTMRIETPCEQFRLGDLSTRETAKAVSDIAA